MKSGDAPAQPVHPQPAQAVASRVTAAHRKRHGDDTDTNAGNTAEDPAMAADTGQSVVGAGSHADDMVLALNSSADYGAGVGGDGGEGAGGGMDAGTASTARSGGAASNFRPRALGAPSGG